MKGFRRQRQKREKNQKRGPSEPEKEQEKQDEQVIMRDWSSSLLFILLLLPVCWPSQYKGWAMGQLGDIITPVQFTHKSLLGTLDVLVS